MARNKQRCGRGGCKDGAVREGLGGGHSAQPHADAASGDIHKHSRSSGVYDATATAAFAVAGGHREIDGAASTLRHPPFHQDFSDDEDEVGAWIWKTYQHIEGIVNTRVSGLIRNRS
jgi:hypothetical protein